MRAMEVKGPLRTEPPEEALRKERSRGALTVSSVEGLCLLALELLKFFITRFRPRSLCRLDTDPDLLPPAMLCISCISDLSKGEFKGVSLGEAIGDNLVNESKELAREFCRLKEFWKDKDSPQKSSP